MWQNVRDWVSMVSYLKNFRKIILGREKTMWVVGDLPAKYNSLPGMNLQRGNALFVMGTVAHHKKLEEIYNLGTIQTQEI